MDFSLFTFHCFLLNFNTALRDTSNSTVDFSTSFFGCMAGGVALAEATIQACSLFLRFWSQRPSKFLYFIPNRWKLSFSVGPIFNYRMDSDFIMCSGTRISSSRAVCQEKQIVLRVSSASGQ